MTSPSGKVTIKIRDAAADAYRDQDFEFNPNGYTVAPNVNEETTAMAFIAGWNEALKSAPEVKALVEAANAIVNQLTEKIQTNGGHRLINLDFSKFSVMNEALASFRAAVGDETSPAGK